MTKATSTKATSTAIQADAEMDKLVTQAEKRFADQAQANLVDLIDGSTRGVLTLFPFTPRTIEEGKTYPVMTGQFDTKRVKVPVAAFAKMTEEGRQFLSLSIGKKDQTHIGGALFRQEEQDAATGVWNITPGKENDRYGVITKTVKVEGTDAYETVYELRFYGKRRLSGAGVPYIKANVYAERLEGDAAAAAMQDCF
jgi:uncharacterized protein (DUF736 family)